MVDFIGLDIGSTTLKAVQVRGRRLFAFAYAPVPKDASFNVENREGAAKFSEAVANLISGGKFKGRSVISALPESQIFTRVISFPQMEQKEIASAVQNEAQQYVPLPLDQTTLDYEVLGPSEVEKGRVDVLLVSAPKTLTQQYLNVIRQARLNPISLEPETMALSRSIVGDTSKVPAMVASIGARTTDLSIFSGNTLRFTRSISTGGETLVRAVSQNLGLGIEQAKEYLKGYGLLEEAKGKVSVAIKPIFDIIVEEMRRSLTYYSTRHGKHIGRLVLVGGVANLPGIVMYLAEVLGVEVGKGNPWGAIDVPPSFPKEELAKLAPDFAVAAGLALKEV